MIDSASDQQTTTMWVYFIQAGAEGPIKIGTARDPKARLGALQIGSPERLTIRGMVQAGAETEAALHERFGALRLTGEWFRPAPELIAYADEFAPDTELAIPPDPYRFEPLTETEVAFIDQLLAPARVAELLGLSRQRVDQLMRDGPLPVIWVAGIRLVLRRDIARYAEVEGLPRPAGSRRWKRVTSQPPTSAASRPICS